MHSLNVDANSMHGNKNAGVEQALYMKKSTNLSQRKQRNSKKKRAIIEKYQIRFPGIEIDVRRSWTGVLVSLCPYTRAYVHDQRSYNNDPLHLDQELSIDHTTSHSSWLIGRREMC